MSVSYDEYKGNRMIILKSREDDKFPFQFGQKKAKLIVQHIDEIRAFAALPEKNAEKKEVKADFSKACTVCGAKPVHSRTGMCGPCTTGEADTAGGNW